MIKNQILKFSDYVKKDWRFLLVIGIMLIVIISLITYQSSKVSKIVNNEESELLLDSLSEDSTMNIKVLTFKYKGHRYLRFMEKGKDIAQPVHDPDCEIQDENRLLSKYKSEVNSHMNQKVHELYMDINRDENIRSKKINQKIDNIQSRVNELKPQVKYITKTIYKKHK